MAEIILQITPNYPYESEAKHTRNTLGNEGRFSLKDFKSSYLLLTHIAILLLEKPRIALRKYRNNERKDSIDKILTALNEFKETVKEE